jgi:hypothetical protein
VVIIKGLARVSIDFVGDYNIESGLNEAEVHTPSASE